MAITHSSAAKDAIANQVATLVNTGGGTAYLRIKTAADATLVDLPMSATPFGASSGGTITANAITTTDATGTGTAAKFDIIAKDSSVVISGTVGTSNADLTITNTNINTGDPISVSSLSYSAPS